MRRRLSQARALWRLGRLGTLVERLGPHADGLDRSAAGVRVVSTAAGVL
jgi:hypothetical protein